VLLYRVFAYLASATVGTPGHPGYLHRPQGRGRLDNPSDYDGWYLSEQEAGAVGEVFADLLRWTDDMFAAPYLPGAKRALGTYEIPDDTGLLDLDDARNLLARGLRPTQVIERNRPATQAWALDIYNERKAGTGARLWAGVRWWSYHRPQWRVVGLWGVTPAPVRVDALDLAHPAVIDAARVLAKPSPATDT
jgi:hypothetical protein